MFYVLKIFTQNNLQVKKKKFELLIYRKYGIQNVFQIRLF